VKEALKLNQNGLIKTRKGVGSIIAGAFVVMIVMSGYALYQLNNKAESDYQEIIKIMNEKDISRKQEKIDILSYETTFDEINNKLTITISIINSGPEAIVLEYSGLFLDGNIIYDDYDNEFYTSIDPKILLMSSETTFITISRVSSSISDEYADYVIHLISENGNALSLRESDIITTVEIGSALALAEVVGDVLPRYKSTNWGKLLNGEIQLFPPRIQPPTYWQNDHYINRNLINESYIFKVDVRYYGDTPLTLSSDTVLYFETLGGFAAELSCYIIHVSGTSTYSYDGNEIILPAWDPQSQELPVYTTLYFGANKPGGDPSNNPDDFAKNDLGIEKYQIKLGIFDLNKKYAQTFSLIAIEVYEWP
jgi:hypothetical protein